MPSIVAFAEAGFEPIPGYVLREKLGAGGFGEVWLADAPGGLKKALKFVFGSIDDSRAAGELKALQRIRQVNHPFVLSLERIEIINGQLIVVTELADGSLHDRYCEMHKRGLAGIPRDRLLRYLGDAADALDYICQQYDLQHLDVKPANLLLVADRTKIADFGLIKDLQRTNNSLISGLTPTYAAPEMFDGRPGRNSDQYSLAIVYQEMLTGVFPFQGRTTAQLATEHLNKAPNLESLPVSDRPVIARALSKKPSQRFSSCREMIDHLIRDGIQDSLAESGGTPTNSQSQPATRPRHVAGKSPTSPSMRPNNWMSKLQTRASSNGPHRESGLRTENVVPQAAALRIQTLPPLEIPKDSKPDCINVFIGLGCTGMETLVTTRQRLLEHGHDIHSASTAWLAIDTDQKSLEKYADRSHPGALLNSELLHIPLRSAQHYKDQNRNQFEAISRRWLYNIPRSRNTEGVRALGLLAFLDHSLACYDMLGSTLVNAISKTPDRDIANRVNVYILSSTHGGTGGALVSEFGFLTRRIIAELQAEIPSLRSPKITAILTAGANEENSAYELGAASAVACVKELEYYIQTHLHPELSTLPSMPLATSPVDDVYLLHGGRLGRTSDWQQAISQAAELVCHDAFSSYGAAFKNARQDLHNESQNTTFDFHPWLRTFSSIGIELAGDIQPDQLSKHWLLEVLINWYSNLEAGLVYGQSQESAVREGERGPQLQLRKTTQAIELFCDDLFRDNSWNAQAWVRLCLSNLLPSLEPGAAGTSQLVSVVEDLLCQDTVLGIDAVQKAMNIHCETCESIAKSMISNSLQSMIDYIRKYWLTHHSNFAFVGCVMVRISQRLCRHAESLKVVSGRFEEKRYATEEMLHDVSRFSEEELKELRNELSTLELQRSVHYLASQLLERLSQLILRFEELWRSEIVLFRSNLKHSYLEIAKELNLVVDEKQNVLQSFFPLPSTWTKIRGGVQGGLEQKLAAYAMQQLESVWGVAKTCSIRNSSNSEETPEAKEILANRNTLQLYQLNACAQESLQESATKYGVLSGNGKYKKVAPQLSLECINDSIRSAGEALLTEGSAKRVVLVLPAEQATEDNSKIFSREMLDLASIVFSDLVEMPCLFLDGERLHLDDTINLMWPMNDQRNQLLKRVYSRIDVDWPEM